MVMASYVLTESVKELVMVFEKIFGSRRSYVLIELATKRVSA